GPRPTRSTSTGCGRPGGSCSAATRTRCAAAPRRSSPPRARTARACPAARPAPPGWRSRCGCRGARSSSPRSGSRAARWRRAPPPRPTPGTGAGRRDPRGSGTAGPPGPGRRRADAGTTQGERGGDDVMGAPRRSAPHRAGAPPGDRRPVRIRAGRSAGDVLAGLGALILLAALLGGVPLALLRYAGPPRPGELLDPGLLTRSVGPETIVALLALVVWLAWAQLVVCVIVEVYAGVRRVGMPARVPFAGGTQALANRLVSAVLLLFAVSTVA